jgi:nucleotide-binding universal stress UspA family protein
MTVRGTIEATSPKEITEIVVPLDGSDLASRALPVAERLARTIGAEIVRLTVVPPDEFDPDAPDGDGTLILPGHDAAETIVGHVGPAPHRLVCMSTHGRGRIAAGLIGSVAESVLRHVARPVVLVGPETVTNGDALTRLVACVDGSAHSEEILPVAARWAGDLGLRLDLVQVLSTVQGRGAQAVASGDVMETSYVRALSRWVASQGVSPEWDALHGKDPVDPILAYASQVPGTIIALATHGRTGWSRVAMGSVAMRIAHTSPTPLLVVRPPDLEQGD